jgi:hypothetical protein
MTFLKVLFYLAVAGAAVVGFALHEHVHSERWKVKTLADSLVVRGEPVPTTIEEQQALPSADIGESIPRQASERTLYQVVANLVEVKKEFDGDYHLVLEDPQTHLRMIAEIPDTDGFAPRTYRDRFGNAREAIDRIVGNPSMVARSPKSTTTLEITGLGFFDEAHVFTPNGMSPNCREIHPVLGIRLISPNESSSRSVLNGRPYGG